ncbi:MAG TPA: DUF4249 family protein, partial [Candidatus Kryptobacter bacterium]|nr:DUF4249 family protein [Candidatus Kryptobacter bacterium]
PLRSYSKFVVPTSRPSRYFFPFSILLLISLVSLSCNTPFQPEEQYTPKLNVYSVLFSNSQTVSVRVTSVAESQSVGMSQPVHGATVTLSGAGQTIGLTDTTAIVDGDTSSFYFAPMRVVPGGTYTVSVSHAGYPSAAAMVTVPSGYAAVPDQNNYSILLNPKNVKTDIGLNVNLSGTASAAFVQMLVECRGLDDSWKFHVASFNVIPLDSLNPFSEVTATTLPVDVDVARYRNAFNLAQQYADSLKLWHLYVDIIVTQVDDNLYRYFITSTRTLSPLLMRTDKIIFTNIFNNAGTGIVAGASVDTTRVFLY